MLSLKSLFEHLEASPSSRCITEAEAVLNANHIFTCGSVERRDNYIKLLALCLKTSALTTDPHEINASFELTAEVKIKGTSCTCKAGQSEKRKHVAALLILCTRSDIEIFEKFSSTDVKCYWKMKKTAALAKYEAAPTTEMECIPASLYKNEPLGDEDAAI